MSITVISVLELQETGIKPYRTAANPWNYMLIRSDGRYGFSLNRNTPTAWVNSCPEHGCEAGWHTSACIAAYKHRRETN